MYQTFIIIFREILEISIILSVVVAATQNIHKRTFYIFLGTMIGLLGSAIIALFTQQISNALDGTGQEITNAATLLIASIFIGWTVVWMKKHGKELSSTIKAKGKEIEAGESSLISIASIIALSIFREGSEVVLFTYSILVSSQHSLPEIITGASAGLISGAIIGAMFYFGIIKFSGKYIFNVTAALLAFISASMASQAGMFLQASGHIEFISGQPLWDSSNFLNEKSFIGDIASIILGYTSRPTIIEIALYFFTLGVIWLASKKQRTN